jgi:hypothetical protein
MAPGGTLPRIEAEWLTTTAWWNYTVRASRMQKNISQKWHGSKNEKQGRGRGGRWRRRPG